MHTKLKYAALEGKGTINKGVFILRVNSDITDNKKQNLLTIHGDIES